MSAHNIAAVLVLTCAVILTFSALFLALTAVPVLIRELWAWINRTRDMWAESPHVRGAIERNSFDWPAAEAEFVYDGEVSGW